jgi:RNA polymerase subunit RPABC4/transcription elongation factor Spt4
MNGAAAVIVIVAIAYSILQLVATFKIITKAGYSGGWMIIVLLPLVFIVVTWIYEIRTSQTFGSTDYASFNDNFNHAVTFLVIDGLALLVQQIFYFIFAFSDWPVRRDLRNATAVVDPRRLRQSGYGSEPLARHAAPVSATARPTGFTARSCHQCGSALKRNDQFCGECGLRSASPLSSGSVPRTEGPGSSSGLMTGAPTENRELERDGEGTTALMGSEENQNVCPNCKRRALADSAFCEYCGTSLSF